MINITVTKMDQQRPEYFDTKDIKRYRKKIQKECKMRQNYMIKNCRNDFKLTVYHLIC